VTLFDPLYLLTLYAPRSVDPDECTPLTPIGGAPHVQPFRVATRDFGKAARIGATVARYFIRNPVGTWPTTSVTVEYWGRLDAGLNQAQTNNGFSYARQTTQFNELLCNVDTNGAAWRMGLFVNGSAVFGPATYPDDNKHHHLVYTWRSSDGEWFLYLDGVQIATGSGLQTGYSLVGGGIVVLGQDQDAAGGGFDATQAWKGELDEVRVYDRVLSPIEIKQHAGGIYIDETGLCARWGFDLDGVPAIGYDSSPAANHLTPVGIDSGTVDTPLHFYPYLRQPEGRSGRIDRLNKRTDVGVQTFQVIDAALIPGDNLTRWATAGFGDAKGKLRIGNVRAVAYESLDGGRTVKPFWTGRCRQIALSRPNVFDFRVRELADDTEGLAFVGRPEASIDYAGFPTLLPVGLSFKYGTREPVTPLVATIADFKILNIAVPNARLLRLDGPSQSRIDNIITKNLLSQIPMNQYEPLGEFGSTVFVGTMPNFSSSVAGGRVKLTRLDTQAVGYFKIGAFRKFPASNGHWRIQSFAIGELAPTDLGYMPFPPNGQACELTVEGEAQPSKTMPFLIGDVHLVTLWKHLLEGKFGYLWMSPEVLPTGRAYGDPRLPVAYNITKMAALEADSRFPKVRGMITKREARNKFIEANLLRLGNLAYYRDGAGVIQPVDLRLPSDVSAVPIISDADLVIPEGGDWPSWEYDRAQAITRIDAAYYIDVPTAVDDLNKSSEVYPEITNAGFSELRHPVSILDVGSADLGDEPFDLDCQLLRAMQDEVLGEQQRETYLERRLIDISTEIARPFQVGAPTSTMPVRRGSNGDAQPGELRRTTVSTLIDPATNKRGGTRLVQVLERTPRGPYVNLLVVDLGLATSGAVPTIATPTQEAGNTLQSVVVNVTLNADTHPAELHYAVTDTSVGVRPVDTDERWTAIPERLVRASGNVTFRGLPSGKRIWVRARTFPDARVDWKLPSAWVYPGGTGYVDTGVLTAPSAPASSNISGKAFRVSWTVGAADVPLEILLATPVGDPRIVIARLPPGSTFYDFPGDSGVELTPSTTYRVGIRHYIASSAVSAEVTIDVATTASPATAPDTGGMSLLIGVP